MQPHLHTRWCIHITFPTTFFPAHLGWDEWCGEYVSTGEPYQASGSKPENHMVCGLVAGSYFQCGAQTLWSPKRYHSGQCIAVNFKQIQEVFAEAHTIYLKYIEAFLRQYSTDLLQWDSKQPIKEALRLVLMQSAMPWLWPSLTNRSLRVATCVDLRVGNVLSWHDLRAFINFLCEKWMPFQWYGKTSRLLE